MFAQKRRSNTTYRKILSNKAKIAADGCEKLPFMENQMNLSVMLNISAQIQRNSNATRVHKLHQEGKQHIMRDKRKT